MLYRFEQALLNTIYCVVEADSLEEAKKKADEADWEDKYSDGPDVICYWGYKPFEEDEDLTLEEYENGDVDIEWDELDKDDDFFNHWHH